jgi:hypothetical protein
VNSWWTGAVTYVKASPLLIGAVSTGAALLIVLCVLCICLAITYILRQFFKRHPLINRAHRLLIYLITMGGVVILLLGGILGLILPIIPGFVLILFALVLLRRYYRTPWMESKIKMLRKALRKRVRTFRAHHEEHKLEREARRLARKEAMLQSGKTFKKRRRVPKRR